SRSPPGKSRSREMRLRCCPSWSLRRSTALADDPNRSLDEPVARGFLARPALRVTLRLQFLERLEDEVLRELRHLRDCLCVAHLVFRGDAGRFHRVVDLVGSIRNIFVWHVRTLRARAGNSCRSYISFHLLY